MRAAVGKQSRGAGLRRILGAALVTAAMVMAPLASTVATAELEAGDPVYIGSTRQGYSGTGLFPVWEGVSQSGDPDYWVYCIEHNVTRKTGIVGAAGELSSYLGSNYFTDPVVQGKVLWVLANSYPALSIEEFRAATGVPTLTVSDAIEATQYAIWRYTDLTFDANWAFTSPDGAAAYWWLIAGVNAGGTLTPSALEVTASVTAPSAPQTADSLIGPFVVSTNQPTVSVTVDPAYALVDANGDPIDPNAVVDGQELYLDLRGTTASGSATVTVAAQGSSSTGMVISVPTTAGGTPTAASHAQSLILVAPSTTSTTAQATAQWQGLLAPAIGTSLVDAADDDRYLAPEGGTLVDTVSYTDLTPGAQYTVTGELMRKSDGTATGITGSTTFTPTSASGTVEVTFIVPAGHAGEQLVAFEELYLGTDTTGTPVAEHEDIDDAAQTVAVGEELLFTKTADPDAGTAVKPGDEITYTVTVTNPSATVPNTTGLVDDDLAEVLDEATMTAAPALTCDPAANICGVLEYTAGAAGLRWTSTAAAPLAPSTTATITYTVTVDADAAGTLKNVLVQPGITVEHPILGSLAWSKVDPDSAPLSGSEWTLTALDGAGNPGGSPIVVTDCTTAPCTGADADAAPGELRIEGLEAGAYRLVETRAPVGYVLDPTPRDVTVAGDRQLTVLDDIVNEQQTVPALPFTGGLSADGLLLAGGGLLGLTVLLGGIHLRRRHTLGS